MDEAESMTAFECIDYLARVGSGPLRDSLEGLFTSRFGCREQLEYAVWYAREYELQGHSVGLVDTVECPECGRVALRGDDGLECSGKEKHRAKVTNEVIEIEGA